tara:strand:+ start:184 stop:2316 length:2133 start_codon:yes stop_codon:yes gene_type:complete
MAENTKIIISAVDKTKKGFGSVTSGLKKVTGAVFSMRTALVGVAGVAGFGLLIKSSLNSIDSLAKTASKIGTTTEALSGLRFAAELTGVATTTMDMALQRFTRRTAEAAKGTGEAKDAIRELGINATELNNMPLDERMLVLADAFSGVKNESDRLRLAFKLFDSEGAALVNTLSQGRDGLSAMLGEAQALGIVMSSDAAEGVEDAVDSLTKLKTLFKGVTQQLAAGLAPAIETLVTLLTGRLKGSIEEAGGSVEQFGRNLAIDFIEGAKTAIIATASVGNAVIGMYNSMQNARAEYNRLFGDETFDSLKKDLDIVNNLLKTGGGNLSRVRFFGDDGVVEWYNDAELEQKKTEILESIQQLKDQGKGSTLIDPINVDQLIASLTQSQNSVKNFASSTKSSLDDIANTVITLGQQPWWGQLFTPLWQGMDLFNEAAARVSPTMFDLNKSMDSFVSGSMSTFTNSFTDAITGAQNFSDAMKSMAKSVIDSLIKMLVQYYITQAAFGAITGFFGGGATTNASNPVGSFDGGGYTGNGSRSGGMDGKGGFMAMLHPQETVIDHTKNTNNLSKTADQIQSFQDSNSDRFKSLGRGGLKETIDNKDVRSFDGGGFTGNGSRSGGVDGKGGFNAILHPNETVTDHTKSINKKRNERENTNEENNSIVVNQTINVTTGVQQTVRAEIVQLMPQIAQAAKGAVADARLRGGNFSKAMGGA